MEWAPQDPRSEFSRVYVKLNPDPNVTPIKVIRGPMYNHKWIGLGTIEDTRPGKPKRIQFHPIPLTPDKQVDTQILRKELQH